MTKIIGVVLLVALAVTTTSVCANDKAALQQSLETWQNLRNECNGNYSYKVQWSSFTGYGYETEVIVVDNQVMERRFRTLGSRMQPGQPGQEPAQLKWAENDRELGQHKEGAPVRTMDELYEQAAAVLERKLNDNKRRYVRFDEQGLLQSCYSVDTRIADDAPVKGVIVSSISLACGSTPDKVYHSPDGKPYPTHWGEPPLRQTRDLRLLPDDYGHGSSTLKNWIEVNQKRDAEIKAK